MCGKDFGTTQPHCQSKPQVSPVVAPAHYAAAGVGARDEVEFGVEHVQTLRVNGWVVGCEME